VSWAIQVNHVSKLYRLGRGHKPRFDNVSDAVIDRMLATAEKLTGGASRKLLPARIQAAPVEIQSEHMLLDEEQFEGAPQGSFWALRDVSFRVDEGQRVGIVGRNGSGKSTLLKILSRITAPSDGEFKYRGRLISLLEIGTGFHPDLTGRENVYLNAKINGLGERQIRAAFDEIVEFSELGMQIDTPIKRYSSGMYMRLAFSVAAHLNSEILVVDEVLAVGDSGFQKKCVMKMLEIGNSGRTLLFVSHDMDAIKKICSTALELSHGRVVKQEELGAPPSLAAEIQAEEEMAKGAGLLSVATAIAGYTLKGGLRAERTYLAEEMPHFDSGRIYLRRVVAHGAESPEPQTIYRADEDVRLEVEVEAMPGVAGCHARIDIFSNTGRLMVSSAIQDLAFPDAGGGRFTIACRIPQPLLNAGTFTLSVVLQDLEDLRAACTAVEAIHLQVSPIEPEPPLPPLPDAPLAPPFDWKSAKA
jgi:homopolymeric O-antigen transport system ATP-binding protein